MGFGFQLLSATNRVQIDQDFKAPRLIASGTSSAGPNAFMLMEMPYDIDSEPPIVLIRPSLPDKYVGGLFIGKGDWTFFSGMTNGGLAMFGQCTFDYAIFSTLGTAVSDGSTWGLEVYKADGSIAFTSKHKHPRLRAMYQKPATTAADGGYPNVYAISGFTQMPWILANPLIVSAFGVGPDSENMGAINAKVNASFTELTVNLGNPGGDPIPMDVYPSRNDYNPYYGLPAWFAVATFM